MSYVVDIKGVPAGDFYYKSRGARATNGKATLLEETCVFSEEWLFPGLIIIANF